MTALVVVGRGEGYYRAFSFSNILLQFFKTFFVKEKFLRFPLLFYAKTPVVFFSYFSTIIRHDKTFVTYDIYFFFLIKMQSSRR